MEKPMLLFEEDKSRPRTRTVAHLLPCRIDHDGAVDPIDSYWKPAKGNDGTNTAYFRGRKLQGKTVALPEQYRGVVVEKKEDKKQDSQPRAEGEGSEPGELGRMRVSADFDEMVVWCHETVPDTEGDPYIRSIEEWLQVSEKIHSYPEPDIKGV